MQKEAFGYITGFYPGYHPSAFLTIQGIILHEVSTSTRNRLSIEKTSKEKENWDTFRRFIIDRCIIAFGDDMQSEVIKKPGGSAQPWAFYIFNKLLILFPLQ